jgi:hypothetical protein
MLCSMRAATAQRVCQHDRDSWPYRQLHKPVHDVTAVGQCTNTLPAVPGDTCSRSGDTGHAAMILWYNLTSGSKRLLSCIPDHKEESSSQGLGAVLKYYVPLVATGQLPAQYYIYVKEHCIAQLGLCSEPRRAEWVR